MRALLTPFIQQELGVVILKPGAELLPYLSGRLLVATEPEEFKALPSGRLPITDQQLANDPRLLPFFEQERVINAAGGPRVLESRVRLIKECQWVSSDERYHDKNLTTLNYKGRSIRLCWACDNRLSGQNIPRLDQLATSNLITWLIDTVRIYFRFPEGHQLTLPELWCWAVICEVSDLMPDSISRTFLHMPPAVIETGGTKEIDITWSLAPQEVVAKKVAKAKPPAEVAVKPVLTLKVDPESPESQMLIPKLRRWENKKYVRWVKSEPCCVCGDGCCDPHHIIGHGKGGMGTKANDFKTIPLCRIHHAEIHGSAGVKAWEAKYGNQIELWEKFIDRAFTLGVLA